MTDDMSHDHASDTESTDADEPVAWRAEPEASTNPGGQGRDWVGQLQSMIDQLTTQAAPVIREIGAKAAELAAMAGDKAGPVAQKAAEVTGHAGQKLAEKSRDFAAELRNDVAGTKTGTIEGAEGATEASDSDTPTTAGVA